MKTLRLITLIATLLTPAIASDTCPLPSKLTVLPNQRLVIGKSPLLRGFYYRLGNTRIPHIKTVTATGIMLSFATDAQRKQVIALYTRYAALHNQR
jgi:hypothetical protein